MKTFLKLICVAVLFASCSKTSNDDFINNPGAPDQLHNRPVGASAGDLLSSSQFKSLKIEIQYMTGFEPDAGAINHLQSTLAGLVNKPSGISIVTKQIGAIDDHTLSGSDVFGIERVNRTVFTGGDQLGVYILYTNGNNTDENVLGVAYKNTSIALFGKKIRDNSGGLGQPSRTKLEATVLEHEVGHLLGLVDLGTPMLSNHKDETHNNHCSNNNCLMYYAAETDDILGFLITGSIPTLDGNCRADLTSNGGQ